VKFEKSWSIGNAITLVVIMASMFVQFGRTSQEVKTIQETVIVQSEDIKDNATYKDPHKYSEGMKYVFVNGKLSVEGGQKISGRYGRVIRSLTE